MSVPPVIFTPEGTPVLDTPENREMVNKEWRRARRLVRVVETDCRGADS